MFTYEKGRAALKTFIGPSSVLEAHLNALLLKSYYQPKPPDEDLTDSLIHKRFS